MNKNKFNCSVGKSYKYNEKVSGKKFLSGMVNLFNPVLWLKDIFSLFNVRKLIIYLLIVAGIFAYGWYKGQQGKPAMLDIGYGNEAYIKLNGEQLHIKPNGTVFVEDEKGNVIKQVCVKDIPSLRRKLAPFGLKLEPFVLGGGGIGKEGAGVEGGVGVSFLRFWKMNLDAFLTNRGAYLGTSYKITDSSGAGIGVGKGWEGDDRVIVYYKFKF